MQVDAFLEVVDLTAVWDEGHRAFRMEQLIFVGVLFKEEVVPWSGQNSIDIEWLSQTSIVGSRRSRCGMQRSAV